MATLADPQVAPSSVVYTQPRESSRARRLLWATWGIPPPRKHSTNPAAQPISLHRSELLAILKNRENYRVSLKADGVRFLLLLTTDVCVDTGDVQCVALMFDRKLVPYEISLWAPFEYYEQGCLFDGELVANATDGDGAEELRFLLFDCIVFEGKQVGQSDDYIARVDLLHNLFDVEYSRLTHNVAEELVVRQAKIVSIDNDRPLTLQTKPVTKICNLHKMWFERKQMGFEQDGIIFTHNQAPAAVGRDFSQFKWKANHTIDVHVKPTNEPVCKWPVWVEHGNRKLLVSDHTQPVITLNHSGVAHVLSCELVENLLTRGIDTNQQISDVLECTMQVDMPNQRLLLFPIKLRLDKLQANQLSTIESTVVNVLEQIDVEELLETLCA